MPLYEYRCFDCGTAFEKQVPLAAAANGVTCPSCAGGNAKRLLSQVAFVGRSERLSTPTTTAADWSSPRRGCSCGCGHKH